MCLLIQDFTLDEKGFSELPQVSESSCPMQFLDVAFICCKVSRCTHTELSTVLLWATVHEHMYNVIIYKSHCDMIPFGDRGYIAHYLMHEL